MKHLKCPTQQNTTNKQPVLGNVETIHTVQLTNWDWLLSYTVHACNKNTCKPLREPFND